MIGIDTRLGADLKTINGDPVQIEQVIMNLSINARDAMPDGGKLAFECGNTILDDNYCKMHVGVSPGEFVRLSISDTGKGMDKQTLGHILILKEDPAARVIIASGYSVDGSTKKELESKIKGFISKPFELNELTRIVRKTLDE